MSTGTRNDRTARRFFAGLSLFGNCDDAALDELCLAARPLEVPAAQCVYREGEPAREIYFVANGRLRVTAGRELLGFVGRGSPVGEIGIIAGEAREATVHALRDTSLWAIDRETFVAFLHRHPEVLFATTQLLIGRLRATQRQRRLAATGTQGTFAIVPASPGVPVTTLAEALVRHLSGWPQVRLVTARHVDAALGEGTAQTPCDDSAAAGRLAGWLASLEDRHRYVIYAAEQANDTWTRRCLRQADRILLLVEADEAPRRKTALCALPPAELRAPIELVILRSEGDPSPHTLAWLQALDARAHYFVHPWHEPDMQALARQVTGHGLGLVLGGGGARGFAHIGLIKALHELEIAVDVSGGTSMGAFVAALLACGYDPLEMTRIARETFVTNNFLNDYSVPRVSLIRGQRFRGRLHAVFGDGLIEDLRRSYYCISTNLTTGATMAHQHGPLAEWVGVSMAVPGVAPPIAHQGELLCDGGVVDNLPTDIMQNLERGAILACSVSSAGDLRAPGRGMGRPDPRALLDWQGPERRPGFGEILLRTATLTSDTLIQRDAAQRADIFISMPVKGYGMFDWACLDELVERGYEHAMALLSPLRDRLAGTDAAAA